MITPVCRAQSTPKGGCHLASWAMTQNRPFLLISITDLIYLFIFIVSLLSQSCRLSRRVANIIWPTEFFGFPPQMSFSLEQFCSRFCFQNKVISELGANRIREWWVAWLYGKLCSLPVLTFLLNKHPRDRGSKPPRTIRPTEGSDRIVASHLPEPVKYLFCSQRQCPWPRSERQSLHLVYSFNDSVLLLLFCDLPLSPSWVSLPFTQQKSFLLIISNLFCPIFASQIRMKKSVLPILLPFIL